MPQKRDKMKKTPTKKLSAIREEQRKRFIKNLIEEALINVLAEQEMDRTTAVPPSPVPPSPQTNSPTTQAASPPPGEEQPEVFTVEDMVDKLNVIRGGKSFADPEVFGRITTFFNSMSDEEKQMANKFLTDFGAVVIDATEDQLETQDQQQQIAKASGQGAAQTTAPQAMPASPPAPVTPTPNNM